MSQQPSAQVTPLTTTLIASSLAPQLLGLLEACRLPLCLVLLLPAL